MLHLGKLLALPTNIRLGCKGLTETNTLAYSKYSLTSVDVLTADEFQWLNGLKDSWGEGDSKNRNLIQNNKL